MRGLKPIIALPFLLAGAPSLAQDIAPGTGWQQAGVTLLDVDYEGTGFHARWEYFQCDCGDVLVRIEETSPDRVLGGELLVVGGRVIAARGGVSAAGDLQAQLQAPTLMLQLAFGLLQRAIPGGPSVVRAETPIAVEELIVAVELNTGMANARFAAPWSISGKAWPSAPGRRRFQFTFEYTHPDPTADGDIVPIAFTGGQDHGETDFPLHDALSLEGWQIQWNSRGEETARPAPEGLTLGQLRLDADAEIASGENAHSSSD